MEHQTFSRDEIEQLNRMYLATFIAEDIRDDMPGLSMSQAVAFVESFLQALELRHYSFYHLDEVEWWIANQHIHIYAPSRSGAKHPLPEIDDGAVEQA